jgi:hypothetical protein
MWIKQLQSGQASFAHSALQVITDAEEKLHGTIDKNKQSGGMHVAFGNLRYTEVCANLLPMIDKSTAILRRY